MGGRCAIHVPSCGRQTCLMMLVTLLLPRAWPLLIKVYWAIRIWYEVCVCLGLSEFSFSYRNIVGTGGFSGRAIMWPRDVVLLDMPSSHSHSLLALGDFLGGPSCGLGMLFYWICPLVTPTPCRHWGIFWEGHHVASGCCSIGYALYSLPLPHYLGLVCFFPSPPAIHLPIPHHQVWQCFAHIKHLKHKNITSGLVRFFPSPLPLVHLLTLPQQVSSAIHGSLVVCMGHLGVHRMCVLKSAHHDTHSAVLVLGFLPQFLFFLWWYVFLFFFVFLFWGVW